MKRAIFLFAMVTATLMTTAFSTHPEDTGWLQSKGGASRVITTVDIFNPHVPSGAHVQANDVIADVILLDGTPIIVHAHRTGTVTYAHNAPSHYVSFQMTVDGSQPAPGSTKVKRGIKVKN